MLPPLRPADSQYWYTYVDAAWIEWLATVVELEHLDIDRFAPNPPTIDAVERAHLAHRGAVMVGYVEGVEIAALCGMRFVPCRNPHMLQRCAACDAALALLRERRAR